MLDFLSRLSPLIMIAAGLALLAKGGLFSLSPFVIVPQILALALIVWARRSFARGAFSASAAPKGAGLIVKGPYRFIRHPMYTATLLFLGSGIAGHWSLVNAAIGLVVIATAAVRITHEERLLRDRFPEYAGYARRTKRILPGAF